MKLSLMVIVLYLDQITVKAYQREISSWTSELFPEEYNTWWSYKSGELGGPETWGTKSTYVNHQKKTLWPFCQQGRQQSPIDIQTERLVYDHSLKSMIISGRDEQLELIVENVGQDLQLSVLSDDVFSMRIKFGSVSSRGSDHRIDGRSLPGEIYAFNGELYGNYSQAAVQPHGLVAISVFLRLSNTSNKDLLGVVAASEKTVFKGQRFQLKGLEFRSLLPVTQEYMTYEGSLPFPGCCESVTWIILNYPISISEIELKTLRRLRIAQTLWSGSMADNFRPVQSLNNRSIRTNINFSSNNNNAECTVKKQISYMVYFLSYGRPCGPVRAIRRPLWMQLNLRQLVIILNAHQ
ncbi:hypothetical protein EG68_01048 [Paragonimus skrjabini miyazakii]|uniref:Alpha-carbonic anhydrase domain-containing protein n=1 Tax=Paragonimus skrjabini miyazakii TaxID=59628 RepID=A0A8S9Z290_9TREM|nr:hypothetical protein EG68_01048 [Paragonimus skrjabini miyazakii]